MQILNSVDSRQMSSFSLGMALENKPGCSKLPKKFNNNILSFLILFLCTVWSTQCQPATFGGSYKQSKYFGAYHHNFRAVTPFNNINPNEGNYSGINGQYKFSVATPITYANIRVVSLAASGFELEYTNSTKMFFRGYPESNYDGQTTGQFSIIVKVSNETVFEWVDYTVIIVTQDLLTDYLQVIVDGFAFSNLNTFDPGTQTESWNTNVDHTNTTANQANLWAFNLYYGMEIFTGAGASKLLMPQVESRISLNSNVFQNLYVMNRSQNCSIVRLYKTMLIVDSSSANALPWMVLYTGLIQFNDANHTSVPDRFNMPNYLDGSADGRCLAGLEYFRFVLGRPASISYQVIDSEFINLIVKGTVFSQLRVFCMSEFQCDNDMATRVVSSVDGSYQCVTCHSSCLNCVEQDNCSLCADGYYVDSLFSCSSCGGLFPNCRLCDFSGCTECVSTMMTYNSSSMQCECSSGSIYVFNGCSTTYGCLNGIQSANSSELTCTSCDSSGRNLLFQPESAVNQCHCPTGYHLINEAALALTSNQSCTPQCGDRVWVSSFGQNISLEEECDDGNTADRDGCSSSCRVQDHYYCSLLSTIINNTVVEYSSCVRQVYVKVKVLYVKRTEWKNQGSIAFEISPSLSEIAEESIQTVQSNHILSSLNLLFTPQNVTKNPIQSFTIQSYSSEKSLFCYDFVYNDTIEGAQAFIELSLQINNIHIQNTPFDNVGTTATAAPLSEQKFTLSGSNGFLTYDEELLNFSQIVQYGVLAVVVLSIIFFVVSSVGYHKMIGLETVQFLQIAFLLLLVQAAAHEKNSQNSSTLEFEKQTLFSIIILRQIRYIVVGLPIFQWLGSFDVKVFNQDIDFDYYNSALSQRNTFIDLSKDCVTDVLFFLAFWALILSRFAYLLLRHKTSEEDFLTSGKSTSTQKNPNSMSSQQSQQESPQLVKLQLHQKKLSEHEWMWKYFYYKKALQYWYDHIIFPFLALQFFFICLKVQILFSTPEQQQFFYLGSIVNQLILFVAFTGFTVLVVGQVSVILQPIEFKNMLLQNYYHKFEEGPEKCPSKNKKTLSYKDSLGFCESIQKFNDYKCYVLNTAYVPIVLVQMCLIFFLFLLYSADSESFAILSSIVVGIKFIWLGVRVFRSYESPMSLPYAVQIHNYSLLFHELTKFALCLWFVLKLKLQVLSSQSFEMRPYITAGYICLIAFSNVFVGSLRLFYNQSAETTTVIDQIQRKKRETQQISGDMAWSNKEEQWLIRHKNSERQKNPFLYQNQQIFEEYLERNNLVANFYQESKKMLVQYRQKRPHKEQSEEDKVELENLKSRLRKQLRQLKKAKKPTLS